MKILTSIRYRLRYYYKSIKELKWIIVRYRLYCLFVREKKAYPDPNLKPIWLLGMFRSGTSLTSEMMQAMGVNFGKEEHLLQPMGKLKELNPNGFFENYVFAEYSRYFLYKLNASGDNPPPIERLHEVNFDTVNQATLFKFSILKIKEDRITTKNKYKAFTSLRKLGLNGYLKYEFQPLGAVKIPLLSFFSNTIRKVWPNSVFLIIFRHPVSTINSSKVLSDSSNYDLYKLYYSPLLEKKGNPNFVFFSYDNLLKDPIASLDSLNKLLQLNVVDEEIVNISKKIDPKLVRNIPGEIGDQKTLILYQELLSLAINK